MPPEGIEIVQRSRLRENSGSMEFAEAKEVSRRLPRELKFVRYIIRLPSLNRELTPKCKFKCYMKPMKDPLDVSPGKGNQGTTRGKEKIILTSVGIEPTTSGLDLPLLCRLSYEVGQRKKVGDDLGSESRRRESKGTYECCAA